MKEFKEDITTVSNNTKSLVKAEVELLQLKLVDETSSLVSFVFSRLVLVTMILTAYVVLIVSSGFYLNQFFENEWAGMGLAGAGSLILNGIVFLARKAIIEYPVQNYIIQKISTKLEL